MEIDLTEVDNEEKAGPVVRGLLALAVSASLALSGCMSAGTSAVSALSVDPLTTAAITPLSAESEIMSDETVIRDLVGGLNRDDLSAPQPWSNTLTGSAGVISHFTTLTDGARTCRLFQTTRHSFDGVALFDGRTCQRPDGGWDLVNLDRTGS
ncbi:RT0821/Lpp0805 family surface protein [Hoeflea sp. YIM 152468]|uniref:RT0821/Lpp0805 family surface protein n=1 Tax=Hoeflea sp. YIM 152468 TaxID=3031759 RepID=UPI0023DA4727|nr:RT0821/Lpp0805 family surface protein [Hoeflea sp. YIM 152468]MDF1608583.1 RT0821/Lpp0805 family surface protein [Hoeflea sp. YIM 152468]